MNEIYKQELLIHVPDILKCLLGTLADFVKKSAQLYTL